MARNKKYRPRPFESRGSSSDTSANIYMSMLESAAWMNLTANQQRLYLYCKAQYYGQKSSEKQSEFHFTMNKHKWCTKYGLYSEANQASFYKDRDVLIAHGFIRVIENGKSTRTKTVYAYWDMWQKWGADHFKVDIEYMSTTMLKKRAESRKE